MMGMRVFTRVTYGPHPWPTVLELMCDNVLVFGRCAERATFDQPGGFVDQHRAAMAAGWLERQETNDHRGRIWLGPCCSGKVSG